MEWRLWSMTSLITLYQDPKVWLEEVSRLMVEMDVVEMVMMEREVMYDVIGSQWSMVEVATRMPTLDQGPMVWLEGVTRLTKEMDVMEMVVMEQEVMYDMMVYGKLEEMM